MFLKCFYDVNFITGKATTCLIHIFEILLNHNSEFSEIGF